MTALQLQQKRAENAVKAAVTMEKLVRAMVLGMVGLVVLLSVLLAASVPGPLPGERIGVGVTLFVLFNASAAVGSGFGFLFGLPRSRFADNVVGTDGEAGGKPPRMPVGSRYVANSNLIKVSDWLTTIVIGLSLANLGNIVPAARSLANALHEPLGGAPYASTLGISLVLGGMIAGFFVTYLWISIRGRALMEESELDAEKKESQAESKPADTHH